MVQGTKCSTENSPRPNPGSNVVYRLDRKRWEGETVIKYSRSKINLQVWMVSWKKVEGKN